MDHIEYTYTAGLDREIIERLLEERRHGVLSLAKGNDAYAVPLSYFYDGSLLYIRVSEEPDSTKQGFIDHTETAAFTVYEVQNEEDSWSVLIRGTIRRLSDEERSEFTDSVMNERFPPFRLFDETVPDVEMALYELTPIEIVGRKTI